jgi:sodium-dependent dicarboxylate transporter 2/3/5
MGAGAGTDTQAAAGRRGIVGLWLGPALCLLVLLVPAPPGLPLPAMRLAAVILWVATWWITEAVPLGAASLLPGILLPVTGVLRPEAALAPYADPTVFLFMGGFFLARAFEKWGLHRRVALFLLSLIGTRPRQLVLGFMVATAGISMWVSNTATAMMMLPIGLAVAGQPGMSSGTDGGGRLSFRTVLMLGIAYSASIGGMVTLIGTPPNLIFAGQVKRLFPEFGEVGFMRWVLAAAPVAAVFLVVAWLYLSFVLMRDPGTASSEGRATLRAQRSALGPITRAERVVVMVLFVTVAAWVFRTDLPLGTVTIPGWSSLLGVQVHDGTIALAAAVLLFAIPADRRAGTSVLDWESASRIPWDVLLLFGGGFALAAGFRETGFDEWMAGGFGRLAGLPPLVTVFVLCVIVVLASEIASNTALTTLLLPVLAATAKAIGIHPYMLMLPATLAASCGFMLPVATPPNAIAIASGYVTTPQMVRAGLALDLLGIVLITAAVFLLGRPIFGLP